MNIFSRELICIICPKGCKMNVSMEDNKVISITGNTCKRGEEYAKKEVTNPTRTVTSTVKVIGGKDKVVPVKTKSDIPKDKIFDCMKELSKVCIEAPVRIGDVIIEDVAGTKIPIVATNNLDKA